MPGNRAPVRMTRNASTGREGADWYDIMLEQAPPSGHVSTAANWGSESQLK